MPNQNSTPLPRDMKRMLLIYPGMIIVGMIVAIIIIPALNQEMPLSNSIQCQMNLHSLGREIAFYQIEHSQNPPNLETLVKLKNIDPKTLVCPLSDDPIGEISYIYRGYDLPKDTPEEMILIYDKNGNHLVDDSEFSRNVLFAGYNVQRVEPDEFAALIDRDNKLRLELGLPEKPDGK